MPNIAVIGDKESLWGFRSIGFKTYEAYTKEDVMRAQEDIVLITEPLAQQIDHIKDKIVLILPDKTGSMGLGNKRLRRLVERAVGVDILSRRIEAGRKEGEHE